MTRKPLRRWLAACLAAGLILSAAVLIALQTPGVKAVEVDKKVLDAEKKRVEAIEKVSPSVVAVMARDLRGNLTGNGSGVLIDDEGYALTNFHVTSAARSPLLKCGLPDGKVYDAVLVGLDKVGDVALIKLLPKKAGDKFPYAKMGNSDDVKAGDWSLAMGNPFSLATDFTPTVTFGLISGVHRYQYPAGTLLEYTDCIQIDTSINPGNSGGPLFNMAGELIGINGRGSFEKRGRVNSGVGYAISINQIKNFLGHLKAGMDTDHASLGAGMESESEEGGLSRILVKSIIDSDAKRRGLTEGDQLLSFSGRPMTTVNQFKNVLGLFPRGWKVPLTYRRDNTRNSVLVRLMGVQKQVIEDKPGVPGKPGPVPRPVPIGTSPAAKFFKAKQGFANYYFNEEAQKRVLATFAKLGDFSKLNGDWTIRFQGVRNGNEESARIDIKDKGAEDKKSPKIIGDFDGNDYPLEPFNPDTKDEAFLDPPGSHGFLLAMYHYRQLLVLGAKGFKEFSHGGTEPFYPATEKDKPDWMKTRVMAEVLLTKLAGVPTRFYFAVEDDKLKRWEKGQLIGLETTPDKDKDPCEVCFTHYKDFSGKKMPGKVFIRVAGQKFADYTIKSVSLK